MTLDHLAARAGVTPQAVGLIERGVRLPRADTIVRLSAALGVTPNDILLRTK